MNYGKQTSHSFLLDSELAEQFRHRVVLLSHVILQALYVEPGLNLDIWNGRQRLLLHLLNSDVFVLQKLKQVGLVKNIYCSTVSPSLITFLFIDRNLKEA
ncbi:Hypothetical_protein [Hexamita inflata]|uniref:Hypothetical_protein n=1 Tax=Hexamita inflata TaxID=28002 RepID=A0AA86R8Q4_9EUKA|nr:Hypothetical protein HINF_LOCUS60440 [Hexamita inflata]